jgi:hypothetical protein
MFTLHEINDRRQLAAVINKDKEATSFHFYSFKKLINDDSTGLKSGSHEIVLIKAPKDQSDPSFYLKNQGKRTRSLASQWCVCLVCLVCVCVFSVCVCVCV